MGIVESVIEVIGNTPIIRLNRLNAKGHADLLVKVEAMNPGGSVKDRVALQMILEGEASGAIKPGTVIIEPTSGNTGVGLAMVAAAKQYRLILTMPETMSMERRKLLAALGAEIVLTPGSEGMVGAICKAEALVADMANSFMPQQFKNKANPQAHRCHTAEEIWKSTQGKLDIFVAGVGTGGTITGVGEILKQRNPSIRIVAVEPEDSPVLSGGKAGPHKLQGIGAGFVPEVLNRNIIDSIIKVKTEDAIAAARRLAKEEGILAGISAGAALFAGMSLVQMDENQGKTVLVLLPDTGERYLSTDLYEG